MSDEAFHAQVAALGCPMRLDVANARVFVLLQVNPRLYDVFERDARRTQRGIAAVRKIGPAEVVEALDADVWVTAAEKVLAACAGALVREEPLLAALADRLGAGVPAWAVVAVFLAHVALRDTRSGARDHRARLVTALTALKLGPVALQRRVAARDVLKCAQPDVLAQTYRAVFVKTIKAT